MNNFKIDVIGDNDASFEAALRIAFKQGAPGGKATHYAVAKLKKRLEYYATPASLTHPDNTVGNQMLHVSHVSRTALDDLGHLTLILFWSAEKSAVPLPYAMPVHDVIPFVRGWLQNAGKPETEDRPNIDGDVSVGWRISNDVSLSDSPFTYAFCTVQSVWAMYGK